MIEGIGDTWMTIPSFYLARFGGIFIFDCNYDINLLKLQGFPQFYIGILEAWSDVKGESIPKDCAQVRNKILWNNKDIAIAGKSIYYNNWHSTGITKVQDL